MVKFIKSSVRNRAHWTFLQCVFEYNEQAISIKWEQFNYLDFTKLNTIHDFLKLYTLYKYNLKSIIYT